MNRAAGFEKETTAAVMTPSLKKDGLAEFVSNPRRRWPAEEGWRAVAAFQGAPRFLDADILEASFVSFAGCAALGEGQAAAIPDVAAHQLVGDSQLVTIADAAHSPLTPSMVRPSSPTSCPSLLSRLWSDLGPWWRRAPCLNSSASSVRASWASLWASCTASSALSWSWAEVALLCEQGAAVSAQAAAAALTAAAAALAATASAVAMAVAVPPQRAHRLRRRRRALRAQSCSGARSAPHRPRPRRSAPCWRSGAGPSRSTP